MLLTGPIAAVVFDLDGVLLESEQVWSAAKRRLTLERGGVWTEAAEHEMLGMSSGEWTAYMRDTLGLQMEPQEISAAVVELLAAEYRRSLPLIDGAGDAVERVARRYPLGLASSSNRETIDLVLELTGWGECFSVTTSSEEVAAGKPAPEVYLETARRLGAAADTCAAVEDSDVGIRSAHAAGLAVVAIPNRLYRPSAEALGLAEVVLDSIAGLAGTLGG